MKSEEPDDRLQPMSKFKSKVTLRRQAISKGLILPNLVEEYSKSRLIVILYIVVAFFTYQGINQVVIRYNTKAEDPLVLKIRTNVEEQTKIQVQQNSMQDEQQAPDPQANSRQTRGALRMLNTDSTTQSTDTTSGTDSNSNTANDANTTSTDTNTSANNGNTNSTDNGSTGNDTSTTNETEVRQGNIITDDDFVLTMSDWIFIITGGLMIVNLICISFGNSPQFNFKFLIFLALLCSTAILGGQVYLIFTGEVQIKMLICTSMFFLCSFIATFTSDNFISSAYIFSNFNADRSFVFEEYTYQRMFGRVSIFWGMRFGKYKRFQKQYNVKQEFPDPDSQGKEAILPPEDSPFGDKYLSNKLESMRDIDEVSQITRPNSPSQSSRSIWNKSKSFNFFDDSKHFKADYERIYRFYKRNDIEHSLLIRKAEQIPLVLPKYTEKTAFARFLRIFKPFRRYKRRLFQKYPFYYPSRILIAVIVQLFIQVEVLIEMISTLTKSFNKDLTWVNFVTVSLQSTVKDIYRASSISLSIVTVLYVLIVIFTTIKTFMGFQMIALDFRLNGYDHAIDHHSIWLTVKFLQSYLGNAMFSTGPFLFIYYLFFWCLFSATFWEYIWSIRRYWLTIVAVFFFSFLLDIVLSMVISNGRYFKSRKCMQVLDIIKIFLGFYSGLFTGFMRFLLSFLFMNVSLFRVDKTGIPNWIYQIINIDIINKPYLAMVKLYHTHNNPIKLNFVNMLLDHCLKLRVKAQAKAPEQDSQQIKLISDDPNKMSPEKRKRFLRAAYRWQLFALMARNPLILEFRKEDRHGEHH